jgi:hypothetical protein
MRLMNLLDAIERDWFWSAYPNTEIRRYKVVPMTDEDIAKERADELEKQIAQNKKQLAVLEEELQKQKKRLKP